MLVCCFVGLLDVFVCSGFFLGFVLVFYVKFIGFDWLLLCVSGVMSVDVVFLFDVLVIWLYFMSCFDCLL